MGKAMIERSVLSSTEREKGQKGQLALVSERRAA
jgi:hypothetical protein